MSYDLYFFRLKQGYTLQDCEDAFNRGEDEQDNEEEIEDDRELDPVDASLESEEITPHLARPFLKASIPPESQSEALQTLLASNATESMTPAEAAQIPEVASWFEWMDIGIRGVWMLGFSYSANLDLLVKPVTAGIRNLKNHNIYVYDPQLGAVLDPQNPEEALKESLQGSQSDFKKTLSALLGEDTDLDEE